MTEFRALPIRRGDAYLLRSGRGEYLFDGGSEGCGLVEMLADRKVRKLRAAVCTNPCRERLGGILELMDSEFNVAEFWFPEGIETLVEMGRRFNGDWESWLHQVRGNKQKTAPEPETKGWSDIAEMLPPDEGRRRLEGTAILLGLGLTACWGWSPYANVSRATFCGDEHRDYAIGLSHFFSSMLEMLSDRAATRWRKHKTPVNRILNRIGWKLFHGGGPEDLAILCGRLLLAEADLLPGGEERGTRSLVTTLALAAMTGALMSKTTAKLSFLRNTGQLEDRLISHHPIKCINGTPAAPLANLPTSTSPRALLHKTKQLTGHKEGLVFQYGDRNCSVLFCSDTKLSFLTGDQTLHLDRPTIITAPRQGSPTTERVYNHLTSKAPEKDIWVRSHYSNARKISSSFKELPNKLCLTNCADLTLQEILLKHTANAWTTFSGGTCVCG